MKITRCKFRCVEAKNHGSAEEPSVEATLCVVTDGSDENREFFKYTPGGILRFYNLKRDVFVLNSEYYLDISEAPAPPVNEELVSGRIDTRPPGDPGAVSGRIDAQPPIAEAEDEGGVRRPCPEPELPPV